MKIKRKATEKQIALAVADWWVRAVFGGVTSGKALKRAKEEDSPYRNVNILRINRINDFLRDEDFKAVGNPIKTLRFQLHSFIAATTITALKCDRLADPSFRYTDSEELVDTIEEFLKSFEGKYESLPKPMQIVVMSLRIIQMVIPPGLSVWINKDLDTVIARNQIHREQELNLFRKYSTDESMYDDI